MSLRYKLVLPLFILLVLGISFLHGYLLPKAKAQLESEFKTSELAVLEAVGTASVQLILTNDFAELYALLDKQQKLHPYWRDLRVKNAEDQTIYPLDPQEHTTGQNVVRLQHTINELGKTIGQISILADVDFIISDKYKQFLMIGYAWLTGFSLLILIIVIFQDHLVTARIRTLNKAANDMADGIFSHALTVRGKDEVSELFACFNKMRTNIAEYQSTLESERQRLAGIIEGTHIGTWEWNVQTGETNFNERWAEIVGYTLEELSPVSIQTWLDLAHPDDLKLSGELLQKNFNGELSYYDFECRMRHKYGHWVWVHDRGRVISWTEDNKPLIMSGTHANITARKLADEALLASEQKLSSLYRMAPVAIALNRFSDGKFIEGNPELYRMVGYTEKEFRVLSYWDITPEEYAKEEALHLESLRKRGTYGPYEKEYIHKDGHRFPVLLNGTLITGQDGETYIWSIVQDISERVRAEQSIKERERYTRTIIDNVVDGIITVDKDGVIESVNTSAEKMFGHKAKEMQGSNISTLILTPRNIHGQFTITEFLESCRVTPEKTLHEYEALRADGDTFPIEFLVSEINYGGEIRFVAMIRDITERKRVERMKNEFVSTVSHELRTPLTSIKGALSLILRKNGDELTQKARIMLETASRNSERLSMLINDILDLEKIESGSLQFDFKPVDVVDIAKQAIISNESYAQQHSVHLETDINVDHAPIWGDEHRLQQVLANLLSNAVKFSSAGENVTLGITKVENIFRVSIKDSGRGIPQEFRSRIFQRFAQADSSDTREKGGTGLGLSITKAIIDRHGGHIDYYSQEGFGTEFFFALPERNETGFSLDLESKTNTRKAAS